MHVDLYKKYGRYYDLIYSSFNTEENAKYVESAAKKFLGKFETLLDVGCGTGDLLIYISKKGYEVWGIDNSEVMVELAREKAKNVGVNVNILLADASSFKSPKPFDVVTCLFGTLGYLHKDGEVESFFRNTFNNLRDGGLFIFDFPSFEFFKKHGVKPSVLEGEKDGLKSIRISLPEFNPITKFLTLPFKCIIYRGRELIDLFEETHKLRTFEISEIRSLLERCSFSFEFLQSRQAGRYATIVARKPIN
jgi:SAM-dependent methyltransferase